jgi:hypothetical protein
MFAFFSSIFQSLPLFNLSDIFRVPAVVWTGHCIRLKSVFWAFHELASLVKLFELHKPLKIQNLFKRWSFQTAFFKH